MAQSNTGKAREWELKKFNPSTVTDVLGGIKWEISTQYAFILKKNKKDINIANSAQLIVEEN